ncbi:MAG: holin [Patulibacter sp.]|nr:holin [Patulibacter sp.]
MGRNFWKQALERAAKSVAQALVIVFGAASFSPWTADWKAASGIAGAAFLLSLVSSIATAGVGEPNDPSAVRLTDR